MKEKKEEILNLGGKKRSFSPLNYFRNKFRVNILDIIFSSIEVMQSEIEKTESRLADVVLHPDLSGLFWLELHKAREFAERGEKEARRHLAKIKELSEE